MVSRTVRDQIRDRDEVALADLGEVDVKNIARPVRAFQVVREGEAVVQVASPRRRVWIAAAAAVLAALLLGGGYWYTQRPDFTPANAANFAYPLPDKPSIAVLAFDNLSGDPSQEYIADGFSEDITSVLARIPELFVIARNSAFSYKGKPTKVQTIAEELGVRYVLEGSLQRSGDTLRVTAQLIDAVDGRHVWAKKYDRDISDLFVVRDEIVNQIVVALHGELIPTRATWEIARVKKIEAWILAVQAWSEFEKANSENILLAVQLADRALDIEPESSFINEIAGWIYLTAFRQKLGGGDEYSLDKVEGFARIAIRLDENWGGGYALLSRVFTVRGSHSEAVAAAERSVALGPGNSDWNAMLAIAKIPLNESESMRSMSTHLIRLKGLHELQFG